MSSQPTRRRFLSESLLTTASAIAAAHAAQNSNLFAQEESNDKVAPNDQISVAVIGVNGRGASHLSAFAKARDTVVTHICDVDEAVGYRKCEDTAKLQGGRKPELVTDLRKLLDDKSIDAVSIGTPNHWHALATIWAVQAGKDVYCEKPVSHNVSEGRRAVQAAAKYGKIVQTGTQSRSNPGMRDGISISMKETSGCASCSAVCATSVGLRSDQRGTMTYQQASTMTYGAVQLRSYGDSSKISL